MREVLKSKVECDYFSMFKYLCIQDLFWVLQNMHFRVKWGLERLSDLLKATKQASSKAQTFKHPVFPPYIAISLTNPPF